MLLVGVVLLEDGPEKGLDLHRAPDGADGVGVIHDGADVQRQGRGLELPHVDRVGMGEVEDSLVYAPGHDGGSLPPKCCRGEHGRRGTSRQPADSWGRMGPDQRLLGQSGPGPQWTSQRRPPM